MSSHRSIDPPVVESMTSDEASTALPVVPTIPRAHHFKAEKANVNPWLHFFAGGMGGMAGALFTSPLDVVKTRLQSDLFNKKERVSSTASTTTAGAPGVSAAPARATAALRAGPISSAVRHVSETVTIIHTLYKTEGARSLFKGLGPNLVGVIPARSINFFTYGLGKDFISTHFNNGQEQSWVHLLAAANAGIVTSTCTNPIWLVKTRLQLDKSTTAAGKAVREYKNSWDCIKKVIQHEGIQGLYRGLSASYLGVVESSLQWVLYEQMKSFIRRKEESRLKKGIKPTNLDSFLQWCATSGAAGAAKFMASLITYPHEVVRTRLRQAPQENGRPKYNGLINCFKIVIKEEGFWSMYGGLTPHLLRTVPNSIIMFGTWELIVRLFS